ncbi:hypothetical protein AVEN_148951-1 [Araneus ventricosus]|uniref:Uncharacterized protein n=1 Tax=Araneus ventricosus TaxID=182803 RepID=A0A4Y2FSL5_ARAVE|nr:hypothetical protein AVEN_148951-1 [Araneus ventricosus]
MWEQQRLISSETSSDVKNISQENTIFKSKCVPLWPSGEVSASVPGSKPAFTSATYVGLVPSNSGVTAQKPSRWCGAEASRGDPISEVVLSI